MGRVLVTSLTAGVPVDPASQATASTLEQRTLAQAVSSAVRRLNEAEYAGEGREVTFTMDPATRRPVVKVVEMQTREVISQWPSEYALRLAEDYTEERPVSR